ncbi:ketohydroxyglutarate aldolase [Ornithinimicrobium cerasi]|uniref:ketohydroxyglutarate aldolase n=1 Tax=Ornithinimicrobium cerasi TaxID=2248773 RepID=UPI000F00C0D7|nr:ketohydroxyglutarate aldolase [Ornithinimicrobium cerasi]
MTSRRVTVTVDDGHVDAVLDVAAELARRGMTVESVLQALGVVTGTADHPEELRDVPGVLSVDAEQDVRLAPPGADVQAAEVSPDG